MIQINPLKSYIDGGVRAAITTPPSASLVFDLPGKAIWVKGVKLKGTDHTYTFSHDKYITLTNTPDSNESEDIKIGVNTSALKSAIDTTYGVVSTTANGLAPKFTSGNKLAASAATTYYFLGWTGTTLKWYQAPFRNIRINSETTDRLGVNSTDPLIISSGNGISVTWDSTNKKIIITNTKPDVNHNTDRTGIKLTTVSGTKKTDGTLILANSTTGLSIQGGTNKFLIGDGTNYIEVPITPSFTVTNKDATIGTALTTIATIAGVDIKAKIASYSLSNHTHSVKINGSTKTITTSGAVDLGNYLPLGGGTMGGTAWIKWPDSGNWSNNNSDVTFPVTRGGLQWGCLSDYVKLFSEETRNDNFDLVLQFGDDNSNGLSIRNASNVQTSYISAGGVITTGTFKGNLDWSYITNKPSSYTPSAHTHAWNSLTHSSTTENQAILTNGSANGWKLYTLNISGWNNAANNAHSHSNKSVLDGITSGLVNNWNTAYNFVNTISGTDTDKVINKWDEIVNFLAGITEDDKLNTLLNNKLSILLLSTKDILTTKTNNALFWVNTINTASSITTGPFTDHPYALLSITNYSQNDTNGKFFYRSRLAFSSTGDLKVASCHHQGEYKLDETWYNVLTSKNSGINGSTIKLNGTSITVYSSSTADDRFVKKAGDTMSGALTINTTGFGALIIKRNDDANGASIQFRGKSSVYGYIGLNNSTKDKLFLRWNSDTSKTYIILDTSSTYVSSGKGIINGTTITQVDNAINSINSTNARKLVNWYSTRPTSLNTQFGDGSLRIFYATSSTTEGKSPDDATVLHLSWDNNGGWDSQLAISSPSSRVYSRAQNKGTWQPWKTLAFTTDIPTSLKNPHALTISLNGTSQGPYDGSAAKSINITPSSIGAAITSHNHDDRYYTKAESNAKYITNITTSINKLTFTKNGSNINKDITVNVIYSLGNLTNISDKDNTTKASSGLFIYNSYNLVIGTNSYSSVLSINTGGTIQIAGNWGDDLAKNLYWRSLSDRAVASYPWKSWRTILDNENYSSILDSRYYTESEVNTLLDAKLNRQNLSYGTWNPRGYNLAADYHYNGGDLSISENNSKMYISVDGCFWLNEGLYRVLDTSDISDIRSSLKLSQYLSATDAAWYPLVWGGSDHKNTNNSTGSLYKSYDKLSWLTSSLTLYATNIQTNNIKNLSVGGGIYWNPYVESTTDGSDAASITLVKSGVAGGTTLVLRLMNDANDTILFLTSTAVRLYHNSYPILTTLNTYVSNNKGYINGTEITLVNNADKVDNRHAISTTPNTGIIYKAAIYTSSSLTSYWVRLASIPSISLNSEFIATIHVLSGHSNPGRSAILLVYLRGNASSFMSKSFKICCNSNYDPNRFRLYYKDSNKTSEIWYQTTGLCDGIITTVISLSSEGSLYEGLTLYSGSITAVQTPSVSTYLSALVSTITDNISGNASTATKLLNTRLINGTNFDGTSNITTSYWGVARTILLTGAVTGSVSTNGSGNITINTTYGTGNITNLDNRYVKKAGDTMTGNLLAKDILGIYGSNKLIFRHLDGQDCNGNYDLYLQYHQTSSVIYLNGSTYKIYNSGANYNGNAATATNADKLDGYHASAFASSSHTHSYIIIPTCSTLNENSNNFSVEYAGGNNSVATKPSGVDAFSVMKLRTASGWYGLILMSNSKGIYYRSANGLTSSVNWIKLLDSSNSNVSGGGNAWGSSITVNINGISKTLTIPGNPNTDYRVTQSETTTANYRPLVLGYTNVSTAGSGMAGSVTNQVYLSNKFYVQPNTGNLYATNFVGTLSGNATTATTLQTARTLWGLSFNGSNNVSGNMSGVGLITFSTLTGTNGRALLYLQMADNDYFRIYVGGTASNSGYVEIATAYDGNEPIYVRQYTGVFSTLKRTLTLLDGSGNTIFPGLATATGFKKNGSSDSYILLGGGGHKAISNFMLKTDELSNNLTTISKSLTVTQAWMDTGIKNTDLPANGTYIVQVSANNTADSIWSNYWSGIMSWYTGSTNDSEADEIILHRAGHAYHHTIYLRTIMTTSSDGRHLRLQIAADTNFSTAVTYTFKFKRVI